MRPIVVLAYRSPEIWVPGAGDAGEDEAIGPQLENKGSVAACDVRVSALAIDGTCYEFIALARLQPHQALPLEPFTEPGSDSLTKAISHSIVGRALAGRAIVRTWPVRIEYRGQTGGEYTTCCEIRVTRMPLKLGAAVIPCG
jgi:hypothetical protein